MTNRNEKSRMSTYPSQVDTGIDYTNPALGGSVGPDKKIIGGRDIVGNSE